MKQATTIILFAFFVKIAIGQYLLNSGEVITGNTPISGFSCYTINASTNYVVNINVTLKNDSAPVTVFASRDPDVCTYDPRAHASFLIETPTEGNTYSVSYLSYADGAQYVAIVNTGAHAASFSIQIDAGKSVAIASDAVYYGYAPPTSVNPIQYQLPVASDSFGITFTGQSTTVTLKFYDFEVTYTSTSGTSTQTITPCDLPQFSSAAGLWTVTITTSVAYSNSPFTFVYYKVETPIPIKSVNTGGASTVTLAPNAWNVFRANAPTTAPMSIKVTDSVHGVYNIYTSNSCSTSNSVVSMPISENLNNIVFVPEAAGYQLIYIYNKQENEVQVELLVTSVLDSPYSGVSDVDTMIYFTYDAQDNNIMALRAIGDSVIYMKQTEYPTIDSYDKLYGEEAIIINPCESSAKTYQFGVLRRSDSSSSYFALFPVKVSHCTNLVQNNEGFEPDTSVDGKKIGLIVGVVIAIVGLLILGTISVFYLMNKRRSVKDVSNETPAPKIPTDLSLKTVA